MEYHSLEFPCNTCCLRANISLSDKYQKIERELIKYKDTIAEHRETIARLINLNDKLQYNIIALEEENEKLKLLNPPKNDMVDR
jgi:predicted RNase H-like nuclease (RuvC/YqgF family)